MKRHSRLTIGLAFAATAVMALVIPIASASAGTPVAAGMPGGDPGAGQTDMYKNCIGWCVTHGIVDLYYGTDNAAHTLAHTRDAHYFDAIVGPPGASASWDTPTNIGGPSDMSTAMKPTK